LGGRDLGRSQDTNQREHSLHESDDKASPYPPQQYFYLVIAFGGRKNAGMKHARTSLLALFGLALAACGPTYATGGQTPGGSQAPPAGATHGGVVSQGGGSHFAIDNQSAATICYVQVSETVNNNWGPDRLDSTETIPPGASRYWTIDPGNWDFRFLDCNRNTLMERRGVGIDGGGMLVTFRRPE
jgi:hypothetical protein